MLSDDRLLVAVREISQTGQRLPTLMLLHHVDQPAAPAAIRAKGVDIGFRKVRDWNVSAILKGAEQAGLVAQLVNGWKLMPSGVVALHLDDLGSEAPMVAETRHSLKNHLVSITDQERIRFVEEAILSFDVGAFRSAIVLSWVGAAHILQEHIVTARLQEFNDAGRRRFKSSYGDVRTMNDFGNIKEADLLQLCQDAGILHKAEKQELQARLDLRNRCGHPNPIRIGEHAVAHHIESLLQNVYSRF